MKPLKLTAALLAGAVVSGCAAFSPQGDVTPFPEETGGFFAFLETTPYPLVVADLSDIAVETLDVTVPRTLVVSEENSYYPPGDIVWRGDPFGDRYEQIEAIFVDGIGRGVANLSGSVPARLEIEVERFHSLSEKTRYTVGGVHSIRFAMTLRHAGTGDVIAGPKVVKANLKGYGGQRALEAERRGQTQKVRITDHLARVIQAELGRPAPEPAEIETLEIAQDSVAHLEADVAAF